MSFRAPSAVPFESRFHRKVGLQQREGHASFGRELIDQAKLPSRARSSASAAVLCQFAGDYGVRLTPCLRGTDISPDMLTDPEAEITAGQELCLIANVLDHLGDGPGLGLQAGVRYR